MKLFRNKKTISEVLLFFIILFLVFYGSDLIFSIKYKLNIGIQIKKIATIDLKTVGVEKENILEKIIKKIKKDKKIKENLNSNSNKKNFENLYENEDNKDLNENSKFENFVGNDNDNQNKYNKIEENIIAENMQNLEESFYSNLNDEENQNESKNLENIDKTDLVDLNEISEEFNFDEKFSNKNLENIEKTDFKEIENGQNLKNKYDENIDISNKISEKKYINLDKLNKKSVFALEDMVIICTNNEMIAYNKKGKIIWKRDLNISDINIMHSKKFMYVVNYGSGKIVKLNKNNKIIGENNNIGSIDSIKVTDDYVVLKLSNSNKFLILDKNVKEYKEFTVPFGDILNYIVSQDEDVIAINIMNIEDMELKSYILQYNLQGHTIGINDLDSEIVFKMDIGENLNIVCDKSIRSYDKNGYMVSNIENTKLNQFIDMNTEKIYILSIGENNVNELNIYSDYGDLISQKLVKESADNMFVNDKYILLINEHYLMIYDSRFNFIDDEKINVNIKKVSFLDDNTFMIVSDSKVFIYIIG